MQLRSTASDDLDFVLATEQHEENREFVTQWTRQQHQQAIQDTNTYHLIIEQAGNLPGGLKASRRPIGYAILTGMTSEHQNIAIQRLVITQKGKGYGKAALRLIQEVVFEELQAHRLWLDVKDHNLRAQHVYEAVGFIREGVMRESLKTGDRFESLIIMSMLESEYRQQSQFNPI